MEDARRWTQLDANLPAAVRAHLEERYWRPIERAAALESLLDDPTFFEDPGRHPAMFADHGVVHVRDVAVGLVRLLETVNGVLLAPRSPERCRFMQVYGAAVAYIHDIGMVDMSVVGRRTHPAFAAHAAWWTDTQPLVEHLLAPGPVRARVDDVGAAQPFPVEPGTLVRELLALTAAHSKSTIPAEVLDDRRAFRSAMRHLVFTPLDVQREAAAGAGSGPAPAPHQGAPAAAHPDPAQAFAWLDATDGPQAALADDVIDTLRALRAADVLRQRGSTLRTSAGYEICFDARTARAVCTVRPADGASAWLVTYDDHRGEGEANLRIAFVTPAGNLRLAFHRGGFPTEDGARRAAHSAADAILDIVADVLPSFSGRPKGSLPAPRRHASEIRIQLERPDDDPHFADAVREVLASREPTLAPRLETVADVEDAAPGERERFHVARPLDPHSALADDVIRRMAETGARPGEEGQPDRETAFAEVCLAGIAPGEVLLEQGSPPRFVYLPVGPGLVVIPEGGYAPSPLKPWVPVGTTGVIRRAQRNSTVLATERVDVVMIPAERYTTCWLRPMTPAELREQARGLVAGTAGARAAR